MRANECPLTSPAPSLMAAWDGKQRFVPITFFIIPAWADIHLPTHHETMLNTYLLPIVASYTPHLRLHITILMNSHWFLRFKASHVTGSSGAKRRKRMTDRNKHKERWWGWGASGGGKKDIYPPLSPPYWRVVTLDVGLLSRLLIIM